MAIRRSGRGSSPESGCDDRALRFRYAADHSDVIRRAIAVVRIGEPDWGLDLAKSSVREALEDTNEPLEDLFQRMGHRRIPG